MKTWIPPTVRARLRAQLAEHLERRKYSKKLEGQQVEIFEVTRDEYLGMRLFLQDLFDYEPLDKAVLGGSMMLGLYQGKPVFYAGE